MPQITRPEICELIGIHKNKLANIINFQKDLKFPAPVGKRGFMKTYDKDAVLAWHKKNPHEFIKWINFDRTELTIGPTLDNVESIKFLRGFYDRKELQLYNFDRLIRSRKRQYYAEKSRTTVRIRAEWQV